MFENLSTKNYNRFRQIKRKFAKKTMIFVNVIKKLRYNTFYINIQLIVDEYAYICFYNKYIISNFINKKLYQQRVNFFKILKKIETLVYRLELFLIIFIYLIIFITQLKLTSLLNVDFYRRSRSNNLSLIQLKNNNKSKNFVKFYEIKRLLNKRITFTKRINYLIK